jgi:putative membrane-bound dehydrogenase-like protein
MLPTIFCDTCRPPSTAMPPCSTHHPASTSGIRQAIKALTAPGLTALGLTALGLAAVAAPADDRLPVLSPADSLAHFTVDTDLEIEQLAAEPDVAQPVYLTFDERGRMWVVQYRQYPFPAGLTVVGHDEYWRVQYDAFPPPPPPRHSRGADKVTILEDRDGDGRFESSKDFLTGLNITTAALPGKAGVWVMNPPYLLFYPDANRDDSPDRDPVVHLAGFGLEDMHAVANSLTWGPDGWIYGCQGSTCTATVTRPGIDEPGLHFKGQAVWRYHPESRRFELFAEGGWNNFALATDEKWRLFTGSNGGIIGVHYVQGGYYRKHFPKHGPFTNPYTFGHVEGMTDHSSQAKLSQAMAFCSADGWPPDYRRGILVARVLQQRIDLCEFLPEGSSYSAHERRPAVSSTDKNFRPVDIKIGPDGAAYIADWHEPNVTWNVTASEGNGLNQASGRIYRLSPKGRPRTRPPDFAALSGPELLAALHHPNQWHRETARRMLRERGDRSLIPQLTALIASSDGQLALEALWALHACSGFTADSAVPFLHHPDPFVRLWTVRLLGDEGAINAATAAALVTLARTDPHPQVRSQLACSARRFKASASLPIVAALAHRTEDARDPNIPLLLWYAVEHALRTDRPAALVWLDSSPLWAAPLFQSAIVARLGRRFTTERSEDNLRLCARLLAIAPRPEDKRELLRGMAEGLAGNSINTIPPELEAAFHPLWSAGPPDPGLIVVAVRLGSRHATPMAAAIISDNRAAETDRITLLRLLAERRAPEALPPALTLLQNAPSTTLRQEALAAAQAIGGEEAGRTMLAETLRHDEAWKIACLTGLASRTSWAGLLLDAVDAGSLPANQVPRDVVRALQTVVHETDQPRLATHWGTVHQTPETKQKRIEELAALLAHGTGDPTAGRQVFSLLCAACHTLHGEGRAVGPDLTGLDRGDRNGLLHAIVDPSASVLPDYLAFHLKLHPRPGEETRQLIGFILDETPNGLSLTDLAGTRTSIAASEIDERTALPQSVMPDGLLDGLSPTQIRDLFAWLQSDQKRASPGAGK